MLLITISWFRERQGFSTLADFRSIGASACYRFVSGLVRTQSSSFSWGQYVNLFYRVLLLINDEANHLCPVLASPRSFADPDVYAV